MYQRVTLQLHGAVKDRIPPDAPADAWNDALNVFFKDGESRRVTGERELLGDTGGITVTPRTIAYTEINGVPFLVAAGEDGIEASDGQTTYDLTPDYWEPDPNARWTSCVLNGFVVVNNSADDPIYWNADVSQPFTQLPDWPLGRFCNAMRAHKGFLFAIGMTDTGGTQVLWSDNAEAGTFPQEWTASASNNAGSTTLAPTFTQAIDGMTQGDLFVLYKEQSIWIAQFTGGQFIFSFREIASEIGLAATNALCRGPREEHLFVTATGDIMVMRGGEMASVLEGRNLRDFEEDFRANPNTILCCATHTNEKTAYVVYAPSGQSVANRALLFDFVSGDISFRDMPETYCMIEGRAVDETTASGSWGSDTEVWADDVETWDIFDLTRFDYNILTGGASGLVSHTEDDQDDFLSGQITATLTKKGIPFPGPGRKGMIRRIWPKITGEAGDAIRFTLLSQDTANGPVTQSVTRTYYIGTSEWLDVFLQGRFLGLEVESIGGKAWRMGTLDLEVRAKGKW